MRTERERPHGNALELSYGKKFQLKVRDNWIVLAFFAAVIIWLIAFEGEGGDLAPSTKAAGQNEPSE
ncbi:hypothetical protein [Sagittula stellata]|uniref:hypothetical protein n=1 Tax=Sagittula stellata TaxID=52603 RepID=UPI0012F5298B|nr:hypothetical protein [Sagittula stellata]